MGTRRRTGQELPPSNQVAGPDRVPRHAVPGKTFYFSMLYSFSRGMLLATTGATAWPPAGDPWDKGTEDQP
jgi:hypothetical protein